MYPAYIGPRLEDNATTRRPLPFHSKLCGQLGALAGMFTLLCLIHPLLATAQGLGLPDIFNTDNLPSGDGATTDVDAARARFIRINGQVLAASGSPLHQPAPAELNLEESRVQFNLFDDTTFTAAIEKTLYRSSTNFIATGVLDGWPGSRITLVANGDIIAATVDVPALGTYQIRYAGNGLHKVVELDKSKIPGCNKIKKAPKNPRPIIVRPNRKRPPVVGSEPGKFTPPAMAFSPASPFSEDVLGLTPPVEASGAGNTNVDVMVVYTAAARIGAGGTDAMNALIDLAMSEANDTFENSEIPVNLNLVFRGEVTYTETANAGTDLSRLQNPNDGYMDAVHVWRNAYGADMVCLFTETMNSYAGIGYLMTNPSTNFSSYSFSVVRRVFATGAYTFPHELGHNFGCAHDRQNASGGAYPYSFGHRFVGNDNVTYRTVMAYSPGQRIPYFSNPNVNYQGVPTGVAIGATNAAYNAASISNTAPYVSAFRTPVVIVSFNSASNSVSETNGTLTINVTRSSLTNDAVTVDYTTINGTALDSSDFTATNGTLSFAGGETTKTITVAVTDDGLRESTETFIVRLSNLSSGSLFTSNATIYVTDDDTSYVAFGSTNITVSESTNVVSVDVVRTGTTNTAVTVGFTTLNVTAVAGSDYVTTNGLLNFAAGETSKTVSVTVLNDVLAENSETFLVRLRTPTNTLFTTATNFSVTITTNDSSVLAFSSATNLVSEDAGTLTLTVNRTGTTNNAVSVNFATTNVTASSASDYSATNGTLSFAAGEVSKTFTLDLSDDDALENTETLRVVLSNPSDARITTGTNTVTIYDNDASTVGFTVATNLVSETNGTLTLTVLRTGATNTAISVDFATTNVTALAGSDYLATNGTLSFAAGETTNTIDIAIVDNGVQELVESFRVRLSSPTNTVLSIGTNLVSIADDDSSTVGFAVAALTVSEDTNSVTITVVRSGSTNTTVSVNYATLSNGTATAFSDFRGTNGILSFAAGVATNTFAVAILNDSLAENGETINLRLSNPTNTSLGTSNLALTITTNDSAILAFSVATNLVSEGDGSLTITVNRTGTTNNAVTVEFTTTNLTASSASDYTATNGTLSFAAGETSQTFTVDLTDDDTLESTETFRLVLSNPTDSHIAVGTNTVTITDDDTSTVGFSVATNNVSETNGTLTFTVIRTGATNTAISVSFLTTNATASAGSDYTATNGTFNFAAGEATNTFTLDIVDDQTLESTENFQVRLISPSNTAIGLGTNFVTITDDDAATIGFTISALNVAENTNNVTITVLRSGATNTVASVRYATLTNGTSTAGTDFRATNGLFTFGLGETSKTFTLTVLDDVIAENNETILLRLSNPTNTTLTTSNLTVTITTNDSAVLSFTTATNTASEGDGTLTFTVLRTGTTNNAVTVDFTSTNVTASSASDYSPTNGTLSFAPGETNQTFTVDLTDDDTQEALETFRLVLSNPVDARLLVGTNTVSVTDDDASTVGFTASTVSVSETNGTVTLTVIRSGATNSAVTVDFATTNGTALAGSDYTTTNGTMTFAAGESTNTIEIEIADNLTQEASEIFLVRLSNASNTTIGTGTNTVTITDEDGATIGFSIATVSVAEDTNSLTITVVRTGSTNTAASVNFATLTNGTATVVSDYRATNGILSFAVGVTTNTFSLAIINDAVAENNETILLRLSSPTNCSLGTSNLTVTVTTNDSAILSFSVASSTNSEADGSITLTVNRTGTTNNAVTVDFTSTNLTASSAGDYSATNGTLSFAPGEISKTFAVDLTDDDNQESTESFRLVLSNPTDSRITIGTNTVTITDDDASTVAFTTNAATVSETNGTLTLTVIRSGATNTAVTVDFMTTNVSAIAGTDYTANSGTLNFAAGETTNTIDIDITDNLTQETNETFQVRLSNASNTSIGVGTNVVTITDEDVATIGFAVASVSVAEDTNTLTIAVVRTGSTNTAASVNFATLTNGTATTASDFRATNGILSFAAGVTTNTFILAIINDAVAENNETILLRLSSPTNCSLGTSNLTVTVTTNDSAILSFSVAGSTNSEADGTVTLTVNRTGTTNNAVTVDFTSTNVTASSASDYTATNGTLSFAAGELSKTFTVDLTDDDTQESTETFRFVLSNPTDSRITVGTNTVTITDDDASTVGFTVATNTVSETNGTLTLIVVRTGATNSAVTVDFATTNVTALAGSDYTASNGTLSFAAGETTNTIDITITDNLSQESTETFAIRLSNASNTSIGLGTNTVTIADEDAASVAFSVAAITVAEDTNTVTIEVVRTGATNTTVTVNFATLTNGTATAVSDYRATNGVLSFAPGVITNTFALVVINDTTAENNEAVMLRLSNPTNTSLGTSNLTVTIATNDSAILSFSVAGSTNSEADGTVTLTVNRTGTTNNAVTVDFTSTNVTASSASDYTATNGTLSFAAGEISKTFTVDLTDDDTQESTENFRLVLSNPTDSRLSVGTNTVTITDDDGSTVGFTATTASVSETNGMVTLTVIRSGATNTTVTVDYATTNATAVAGSDYTADSGTLTFNPGETTNTVVITLADNDTQELSETFQVRLSNVSNSSLINGTNVVTITDDDGSTIGFTVSTINVAENTNTVTLTVVRSGATNTAASVVFTNLSASTATAGTDFIATNGVLSFAAGVTTNTFAITVINDLTPENNEYIAYRLASANNCSLGTSNVVITITTNDSAVLAWSVGTTNLAEDDGTLTLTVNRTGTTNNAVTVSFTTTNVSAAAESDYTSTNGTLSFAAGETSQTITVDVSEDDLQEANETFRVVLSNPVDGTITLGTNTVTITDNDGSTLTLTTNAVSVDETNVSVTLTVIREGATNTAVAIDYFTTNLTASAGSDYTADSGTLAFAPGETTNTVTITLDDDLIYEANETFRVILSGITNSTLVVGTNTVTIADDDYAAVGFTSSTATANELDGTVTVVVERTGSTNTEVSVAYNTLNLTATAGTDYTATSGVLTFAAGETNQEITVNVTFDDDIESPETFRIRLVSFTNAAPDSVTNLTVTINDAFGDVPAAGLVSITSVQAISPTELRLQVTGPNGAGVAIEATTNFTHWVPVVTNVISGNGFQWTTPIDPALPARFFRVSPPSK